MSTPHRRSDAPARARQRAALATICAALLLVVVSAGYAEARGAPRWLSRLFRSVSGRADVAAPTAPSDTVVLFGPKVLSLGSATSANFVEQFTVSGLPTSTLVASSSGYLLRTTNGPNGAGAVTGGSITLNGSVVVTGAQLAALGAGSSLDVPVQIAPSDTLLAALTGPGGSAVSVSVLSAPDPTFLVFGPKQYERENGTPVTVTERFTVPQGGIAPSYLCVRNGELDGTRRNSSATVILNGVTVVTQAELNQQVAGFRKKVTFLPAGQENVLQVQLQGSPGSRLTLCGAATDAAPPTITVTAPTRGLITNKTDVDAVGVVNDQTAVTITVNGQPATVAAGTADNTSFNAKVALPTEGSNTITIHAVDAAGNATDSVRTVIRDTQAPVVTLDALPDSALYRKDSVLTITGTITDATAVTANVNGVALVVDTTTHAFSQQVSLAQGTNFISITATDAAGNATSVVRQVTVDNVPPTLTLTAPAQGAIGKVTTATVVGTAVAQSAVTVTVNNVNVSLGANGAFTANVPLSEGSNTITVVASNAAGVTATATRTVILDTQPPAIAWNAPADSSITKLPVVDVSGTITDGTAVTLTLNGAAVGLITIDPLNKSFLALEPLVEDGSATLTLVATDAAGNVTTAKRTITKDATPPTITVIDPIDNLVVNTATAHVVGSVADLTKSSLTVNGTALTLAADGGFVGDVPLVAGANTLSFVATDAAGNQSTVTRTLVRDVDPPVVTMSSPSDNVLVKTPTITVSGTIADASAVTATLNGTPLTLAADKSYVTTIALSEGTNVITLVATDAANNATTTTRSVTLDTQAPVLAVTSPADGFTTQEDNVAVAGTATDQSSLRVTVNGTAATLGNGGAFSATVQLAMGANAIQVVATDSAGNATTASRSVTREPAIDPNLPPNPKTVAPALDRTVATTQAAATSFLYTGTNPIQTGVAAGTIVATRASTLRGRVITQTGTVLPGASVSIMGHPEFGSTKSRADGWYDLVVNGGGKVTVQYAKDGYLGAQRVVNAPAQDYGRIDDVALIKPDPVVSAVQLGGGVQVAQGSPLTDNDGSRKATMIFDAGTTATLTLPNGTTQPISSLSIRLTEYTVGSNGREAMPAPLPPASGYTYAVSPTADEAVAVGGNVTFSKPVSAYVDDFLGFPVGTQVPLGVLDVNSTAWVPQPDGRVIKVLSVSGGTATIDANGDGAADPQIVLDSLGFTTTELQQLAATYTPGKTLMRTRLFGLYPFDANLPFKAHGVDPVVVAPPGCASATRDIIKCDVRVATQAVDVPGTPYTLAYTSARAAGAADRTLRIPVTGATMPAELMGAYVRVWVAGQMTEQQYAPAANITYEYQWDGNDAYGRPVQGNPIATVEIGHLFPVEYQIPASTAQSFGLPCAGTATGGTASCVLPYSNEYDTERHSFWRVSTATTKLGGLDAKAQGLGGFDFNVHHQYDPVGRVLYLGDGTTRIADAISPVVTTVYGNGCSGYSLDNIKATDACMFYPHMPTVVAMPDGSFLVPNTGSIKRVRPDGISVRFAGDYPPCPPCYPDGAIHGEGGPATSATVGAVGPLAIGPDGSVFAGSEAGGIERIVRIWPNGILTRVAGIAGGPLAADGRPVRGTSLEQIQAITVGPDGAVYFVQRNDQARIYRIGPDSVIRTFAGNGVWGSAGDGGQARQAQLAGVGSLTFGPDGSLYIGQYDWTTSSTFHNRVRRVTPDGVIRLVAGGGAYGPDGVPATNLAFYKVQSLAVSNEGVVSIGDHNIVYQVAPDGLIHYVAGDYTTQAFTGDKGPSLKAGMSTITGLAYMTDGSLLIYDADHHRIRKMAAPMPGFGGGAFLVPSADGKRAYSFDAAGRHLKTIDQDNGAVLYIFTYDSRSLLVGVKDKDGELTQVERDASGRAVALIAATGQRTTITVDPYGNLASYSGPDGHPQQFSYTSSGLLISVTNKNGDSTAFAYDTVGKLSAIRAEDGSLTNLSVVPLPTGQTARITSAAGMQTNVTGERMPNGDAVLTTTLADGWQSRVTTSWDGTTTTQMSDGSVTKILERKEPTEDDPVPLYDGTITIPTSTGVRTKTIHTGVSLLRDVEGDVAIQTDSTIENGRLTLITHDRIANTIRRTSATGLTSMAWLDSLGRVRRDSTPTRGVATYSYDSAGRLESITRGSRSWRTTYDSAGQIASREFGGRIQRFRHDKADQITTIIRPSGDSVVTTYDDQGQVVQVMPPGRPAHNYTYTATGLVSTYTPPSLPSGLTKYEFTYDADSRPTRVVRPGADTVAFQYDTAGHLASVTSADGRYQYTYDGAGRLKSGLTPSGSSVSYEFAGPLLARKLWGGQISGDVRTDYTNDFVPGSQSIAGAGTISYAYDADLRLRVAGDLTIERRTSDGLISARVVGATRISTSYDAFGNVSALSATQTPSGTSLYEVVLERDTLDRTVRRTETILGARTIWTFAYDTASRLASVARDGIATAAYEYDANGNRIKTVDAAGIRASSVDVQDRLTAFGNTTFGYTPSGELRFKAAGSDTTWYHYSPVGALLDVRLADGTRIDYTIDAEGRRIGKSVNGTLVKGWLYDGGINAVAEVAPTKAGGLNTIVSRFVYGELQGVPEYMIRGGVTYRFVTDEIGSIRLVVNASTGEIAQQIDYDSFGRITRNTNPGFQPFGFSGGLYDEQTGFVRLGARDYDPEHGRWTSKDPIGFRGSAANLYEYALNDPLNHVDRTGLTTTTAELEVGMSGGNAVARALMQGIMQSIKALNSPISVFVLPFYYGPRLAPNFPPIEEKKAAPFVPPPENKKGNAQCKLLCFASTETKMNYCGGSSFINGVFVANAPGAWSGSCNTVAGKGEADEWINWCYERWIGQ